MSDIFFQLWYGLGSFSKMLFQGKRIACVLPYHPAIAQMGLLRKCRELLKSVDLDSLEPLLAFRSSGNMFLKTYRLNTPYCIARSQAGVRVGSGLF